MTLKTENSLKTLVEVKAPDFSATGLTGATAGSRMVGATASGHPTTGSFVSGDWTVDQTGAAWVCTASGSPGTWVELGSGGSSTAVSFAVSQTAHGFTVGALTPVLYDGTAWTASDATAPTGADVHGMAVAIDANNFTLYLAGSQITGLTGLTAGDDYFLAVGGGITTTEPSASGEVSSPLGVAESTTAFLFLPERGLEIPPAAVTYMIVKLVDDNTSVTTGEGKFGFVIPSDLNGLSLSAVLATCTVAPTGTGLSFGIRKNASTEMLSTNVTIDTTKHSSTSSATPPVIKSDGSQTVATDDVVWIDCDQADSNAVSRGTILRLGFS